MNRTEADPKGLVRESYAIEGITHWECRSIFVDWALSLPVGGRHFGRHQRAVGQYASAAPDHPMSATLTEGLGTAQRPNGVGGEWAVTLGPSRPPLAF